MIVKTVESKTSIVSYEIHVFPSLEELKLTLEKLTLTFIYRLNSIFIEKSKNKSDTNDSSILLMRK